MELSTPGRAAAAVAMQVLSSSTNALAVGAEDADALHAQVLTNSLLNRGTRVPAELVKEFDYYMPQKQLASQFVPQRASGSYINLPASVVEGIAVKAAELFGRAAAVDLFAFRIIKDKSSNKVACYSVVGMVSAQGSDAKSIVIAEHANSADITIVSCQEIKDKAARVVDLCFVDLSSGGADACFAAVLSDGSVAVHAYNRSLRSASIVAQRRASGKTPLSIIQQPAELLHSYACQLCLWLAFDDGRAELLQASLPLGVATPAALERACSVQSDKAAAGALLRIESLDSRAGRGAALAMYFLNAKDNVAAVAVVDCRLALAASREGSGEARLQARPAVTVSGAARKAGLPALLAVDPLSVRAWGAPDSCSHSFDVLALAGTARQPSSRRLSALSCQQKVIDAICSLGVRAFVDPDAELSLAPGQGQSVAPLPAGVSAASCDTLWGACWHLLSGDRHEDIRLSVQNKKVGLARAVVMETALEVGLAPLVCEYINAAAADDSGVHSSYLLADIGSVHQWFLSVTQRLEGELRQYLAAHALPALVAEDPAGVPQAVEDRLQSLLVVAGGVQAVAEALVSRKRASADVHGDSDLAGHELQEALRAMSQQLLEVRLMVQALRTVLLCLREPLLAFAFMRSLRAKEALMQACFAARPSAQPHSVARYLPGEIVGDRADANTSLLFQMVRRFDGGAPVVAFYTSSAVDTAAVSELLLGLLLLPLSVAKAMGGQSVQDWAEDAAATAAQVVVYVLLDALLASKSTLSTRVGEDAATFDPSAELLRAIDVFAGRAARAAGLEAPRANEVSAAWKIDKKVDAMAGVSLLCRDSSAGSDSALFYAVVRRLLLSDLCAECREILRCFQHSSRIALSSTGALALACASATPDTWLPGWHAARRYCKGLGYEESALARRLIALFLMRWTTSCGQLAVFLSTPMDAEEQAAVQEQLLELAAGDVERRDPVGPRVDLAVAWLLRVGRAQAAAELHEAHYAAVAPMAQGCSPGPSLARRHHLLAEALGFPALQLRDFGGLQPGAGEQGALLPPSGMVTEFDDMSFSHSGFPVASMQGIGGRLLDITNVHYRGRLIRAVVPDSLISDDHNNNAKHHPHFSESDVVSLS